MIPKVSFTDSPEPNARIVRGDFAKRMFAPIDYLLIEMAVANKRRLQNWSGCVIEAGRAHPKRIDTLTGTNRVMTENDFISVTELIGHMETAGILLKPSLEQQDFAALMLILGGEG